MLIETLKKFYEARLKELQKDLGYISSKRNARSLILASFLFVVLVIFCSSFEPRLVFFAPLPPIILFSVVKYLVKKRKNEIEYYLTDALFQASSLSDFAAIEEIVKTISESNYGALSEEFSKVYKEIKTGSSFEDAIMKMCKRNRSRIVERSMSILLSGYQTGSRISEALRETAEDISQTFDIHRQRAASMTIEKYTLLLAGGIIVPLLLGSMISLVQNLNLNSLDEFGLGLDKSVKDLIFSNSVLGNQVYIGLFSVIASLFVANQENKVENFLVYVSLTLPTSLILFNMMKSMNILGLF